jgi:hypothetical protein
MKQLTLAILIIISALNIIAQDSTITKKKKITFDVHGFVKTDYWYDSRQVIYAREGLFTLFPANVDLDKNGNDINAQKSFNYSAITSRVNMKINGMNAFGAKTFGYIEADFSGMSNVSINSFRLRHAYIQLDWEKNSLLLGQNWHPLFVSDVFPTVISLNTGVPFQPFNRSTQIRYTHKYKNTKIMATVLGQRDHSNIGPLGRSYTYLSNSLIPNFNLLYQYNKNNSTLGLSYDVKVLKPRQKTDSNIIATSRIVSNSLMAYYKWTNSKFEFKLKAIYGENLSDNLLLGGYAVATIDSTNDARTYTTTKHAFMWMNFIYHKNFKKFSIYPALFVGYSKNLGTKAANTGIYYSTGSNIDNVYRIAPSISIKSGNFMISVELESTTAAYGTTDNMGIVTPLNTPTNNRLLLTGFYFF